MKVGKGVNLKSSYPKKKNFFSISLILYLYEIMDVHWTYYDNHFMMISRQEHWRGLPFPSPRDFRNPKLKKYKKWYNFISKKGKINRSYNVKCWKGCESVELLYFTGMGIRSFWKAIWHSLFSWNTVNLQYSTGFRCTMQWLKIGY